MKLLEEKLKRYFQSDGGSFDTVIYFGNQKLKEVHLIFQSRILAMDAFEWDELCDMIEEIKEGVVKMST